MENKKFDQTNVDEATEAAKTAPRGMAPDKAHAASKSTGSEPDVDTEETFDNSPNNAGSLGNKRLK